MAECVACEHVHLCISDGEYTQCPTLCVRVRTKAIRRANGEHATTTRRVTIGLGPYAVPNAIGQMAVGPFTDRNLNEMEHPRVFDNISGENP
jgi:hypothetical protein